MQTNNEANTINLSRVINDDGDILLLEATVTEGVSIADEDGNEWCGGFDNDGNLYGLNFDENNYLLNLNGNPTCFKLGYKASTLPAEVSDNLNPKFLFSGTDSKLLVNLLKSKTDLTTLLKKELVNRGLDKNGKWIGFDKSAQLFKVRS